MAPDAELLRNCRMVLCLPCGDGKRLLALRARGIPAVGLDPDPAAVQQCRALGLVAYQGQATILAAFRHRFDGAWLGASMAGSSDPPAVWNALGECLQPGARILVQPPAVVPAQLPAPFELVATHDSAAELRTERTPAREAPGLRIGPYADLFIGCRRIVELGAGTGRFLDALRLRELDCTGLDQDPAMVAAARRRGHTMHCGGLEVLAALPGEIDGLFIGHAIESLTAASLRAVFDTCRRRLTRHGRLVVRAERALLTETIRPAIDATAWHLAHQGVVPLDGRDGFLLLLAGAPMPESPAPAAVALPSSSLPIDRPLRSLFDLERFERRDWSQGGEDGVLQALFEKLGTKNRHCVEFGCGDGVQCNTAALRRRGWRGLLMDGIETPGAPDAVIHRAWIAATNINALLDQHGVPDEPDLLSIDLDGNDYWVWQAIARRPRVVIAEYNANLAADRALSIPYDPEHRWNGTDYYGASLLALVQLGRSKGYTLVYCTQAGVNAFFVRDDLLAGEVPLPTEVLYRAPNYWYRAARSLPDLSRTMQQV